MKNLRLMVIAFLHAVPEDKYQAFNEAYELYKQCPGKHFGIERQLNNAGFTDQGLQNLLYDLQKINEITDLEIAEHVSERLAQMEVVLSKVESLKEDLSFATESLNVLNKEKPKNLEAITKQKEYIKILESNITLETDKEIALSGLLDGLFQAAKERFRLQQEDANNIEDIALSKDLYDKTVIAIEALTGEILSDEAIKTARPEIVEFFGNPEITVIPIIPIDENANLAKRLFDFVDMPENAPAGYKAISGDELMPLREEFPFLSAPDCPDMMFVVVGKRISSFRKYQELHAKIQDINEGTVEVSEDDKLEIILACDAAAEENRKLWDELNYFNEKGEILGKHPLFRETIAKREVDQMTAKELANYVNSSAKFFSTKKSALTKEKNLEKIDKINEAVADRKFKLDLVNAKLGANGGQ